MFERLRWPRHVIIWILSLLTGNRSSGISVTRNNITYISEISVSNLAIRSPRRRAVPAVRRLLVLPALLSVPAVAQEATDEEREEIVVLGTRARRDPALSADRATERMSQSSRSLQQDLLQAAGTYRLGDALELVSGSSQQNNRGGFADNFAIRGFLSTADGGGEYYVDGFVANRGSAPARDPATIERIEILKGPAGAVFGDIDPAGRVNMVTKTPRFAPAASARLVYGSFDTRRIEIDATGPLVGNLAGRIVVAAEDSDGFRDFVRLRRRTVAPSLTFRPSEALQMTYVGQIIRYASPFDRGVVAVAGNPLALPASRFLGEPSNGDTRASDTRHQLTGEWRVGAGWSFIGGLAYRTGSLRGSSADQSRLVGGRMLWRQRRERGYEVNDLAARLELRGELDALGRHRPALGVKAYRLDYLELLRRRNPSAAAPYAIDIVDPVYGVAQALPLLPSLDQREKRDALAIYAQDLWDVTERLSFVGGMRLDTYRQELRRNLTGAVSRAKGAPVTFRMGARYLITSTVSVHGNWGESNLLNSGSGRDGAAFAPERGHGYEAGLSGRWADIDAGITWFDIAKSGVLTTDPIDANFLAPVGSLRSRGIDLDIALRLGSRWQAVVNYAWTRARYDDRTFATTRALNVPDHAGSVFVMYRSEDHGWSLNGGVTYVGKRSGATDTSGLTLPAYLKLKAAAEVPFGRFATVRVEADNLLDRRYALSSYNSFWIYPGMPRTIRISLANRL
ncbi:TonB-dependent siderophore receptor [Sphingomonas sp. KR1UV-12]|uniref:TonB-dependent siderophore receptor n=1 Tax=Sphingomonas aurea TaxID=3063994 RepID=A0ABT9EN81_9SPHN|nr:TonB-dependent siderophore receptor [Sphingomonas sp. KR1UV-12]MDP1028401.1 TonB-dependent siderophore receptor [Sphingomonas sp. KR1UV-12]